MFEPASAVNNADRAIQPGDVPNDQSPDGGATVDVEQLLAEVVRRVHRRYPDATVAYVNHPHDDEGQIILWNIENAERTLLWPDEHGQVFEDTSDRGEGFWLGDRDGDPFAELAEINLLLTRIYRTYGAVLFEDGELGGGWYLPLAA